jgi:DNA polymerase-3 subunit beta
MVATDGHRLSYVDRELTKSLKLTDGMIVPRKSLGLIRKMAELSGGHLKLAFGKRELTVIREASDDEAVALTLYVRLIEGKFPKYEQVIPQHNNRMVSLPRQGFMGALRRAAIMAHDTAHPVCFSISPGHMEISSSNPDLGEVKEDLEVAYTGDAFQVGFNARYFLDVLSVLQDEQVVLVLGDELSPCVIKSEFDRGLLALVMPMRI